MHKLLERLAIMKFDSLNDTPFNEMNIEVNINMLDETITFSEELDDTFLFTFLFKGSRVEKVEMSFCRFSSLESIQNILDSIDTKVTVNYSEEDYYHL